MIAPMDGRQPRAAAGEVARAVEVLRLLADLDVPAAREEQGQALTYAAAFALAGHHADRVAATNDLAVGAQVGPDAEQRLHADQQRRDQHDLRD